jgi:hypothetical protein
MSARGPQPHMSAAAAMYVLEALPHCEWFRAQRAKRLRKPLLRRIRDVGEADSFVCHGDDGGPWFHPCRRVQEALRGAGIEYQKVIAAHGSPIPFLRRGSRDQLFAATDEFVSLRSWLSRSPQWRRFRRERPLPTPTGRSSTARSSLTTASPSILTGRTRIRSGRSTARPASPSRPTAPRFSAISGATRGCHSPQRQTPTGRVLRS